MAADCPTCGARVLIVDLMPEPGDDRPGRVVLDSHEAASGPGRYAIWDDGTCRPVAAAAEVLAHTVHRCRPPLPR
jgi:hypothetical protein